MRVQIAVCFRTSEQARDVWYMSVLNRGALLITRGATIASRGLAFTSLRSSYRPSKRDVVLGGLRKDVYAVPGDDSERHATVVQRHMIGVKIDRMEWTYHVRLYRPPKATLTSQPD